MRSDIDTMVVGQGLVAIVLSLLMSVVQLGRDIAAPYAAEVAAVFAAALEPPPQRPPSAVEHAGARRPGSRW